MKKPFVVIPLVCGLSALVWADPAQDRISSERNAVNAKLAEQERECANRFIVAPCIEDARNEHRAAIARLRQQELQLDEERRREAADARRKEIAERVEAQRARASDAATADAPRVQVRRPLVPPSAAASRPAMGESAAGQQRAGVATPDRALLEQRNRENFEARQREAQAHRDEVARRNAERAAKKKVAAPLPPGDASSSTP